MRGSKDGSVGRLAHILGLAVLSSWLGTNAMGQEASPRDPANSPAPPETICLTNACSEPLSALTNNSDKAGQNGPGVQAPALSRSQMARNIARAVSDIDREMRPHFQSLSNIPDGAVAELSAKLVTPDGRTVPVVLGVQDGNVAYMQAPDSGYVFGATVQVGPGGMVIQSAIKMGEGTLVAPPMSIAPGGAATVTLADGSRLTWTGTLRAPTTPERTTANLIARNVQAPNAKP